jgi:hypothetical protein
MILLSAEMVNVTVECYYAKMRSKLQRRERISKLNPERDRQDIKMRGIMGREEDSIVGMQRQGMGVTRMVVQMRNE